MLYVEHPNSYFLCVNGIHIETRAIKDGEKIENPDTLWKYNLQNGNQAPKPNNQQSPSLNNQPALQQNQQRANQDDKQNQVPDVNGVGRPLGFNPCERFYAGIHRPSYPGEDAYILCRNGKNLGKFNIGVEEKEILRKS